MPDFSLYGLQPSVLGRRDGTTDYSDTEKLNFKVSSSKLPGPTSYLTSVSFSRSTTTLHCSSIRGDTLRAAQLSLNGKHGPHTSAPPGASTDMLDLAFMAYSLASWDAEMALPIHSDTEQLNFKVSSSKLPGATRDLTSVSFSRSTTTLFRDRNFSTQLADDYSSDQVLQVYVQDGLQAELGGGINPSKSAEHCKFLSLPVMFFQPARLREPLQSEGA